MTLDRIVITPLETAIKGALMHERVQRRMAAQIDAADKPRIVEAQLQAEAQPTDEAALPAAE